MPMMLCVKCKKELRCKKNEVIVRETRGYSGNFCALWYGDLWECPVCHFKIIAGFGANPIVEPWESRYKELAPKFIKQAKVHVYELA